MSLAKRALELPSTNALRKQIELFLSGENNCVKSSDIVLYRGKYTYIGKSKKIKSEIVEVLKDTGLRCKVRDEFGNITTITKSMLKK